MAYCRKKFGTSLFVVNCAEKYKIWYLACDIKLFTLVADTDTDACNCKSLLTKSNVCQQEWSLSPVEPLTKLLTLSTIIRLK